MADDETTTAPDPAPPAPQPAPEPAPEPAPADGEALPPVVDGN